MTPVFSFDLSKNLRKTLNYIKANDTLQYYGTRNIAEIGCFEGCSTHVLHKNFKDLPFFNKIYCIDPWDDDFHERGKPHFHINYHDQFDRFTKNIKNIRKDLVILPGKAEDILPKISPEIEFDFVYIDGDHFASSVYKNGKDAFSKLSENGYILFDDYLWGDYKNYPKLCPYEGIEQFIDEHKDSINIISKDFQVLIKKR